MHSPRDVALAKIEQAIVEIAMQITLRVMQIEQLGVELLAA